MVQDRPPRPSIGLVGVFANRNVVCKLTHPATLNFLAENLRTVPLGHPLRLRLATRRFQASANSLRMAESGSRSSAARAPLGKGHDSLLALFH